MRGGSEYNRPQTCPVCGYSHTSKVQVFGDFDGWSDDDMVMHNCPVCVQFPEEGEVKQHYIAWHGTACNTADEEAYFTSFIKAAKWCGQKLNKTNMVGIEFLDREDIPDSELEKLK